jgi:hypothetical protein
MKSAEEVHGLAKRLVEEWESLDQRADAMIAKGGLSPALKPFAVRHMQQRLGGQLTYEAARDLVERASGWTWNEAEKDPISA